MPKVKITRGCFVDGKNRKADDVLDVAPALAGALVSANMAERLADDYEPPKRRGRPPKDKVIDENAPPAE